VGWPRPARGLLRHGLTKTRIGSSPTKAMSETQPMTETERQFAAKAIRRKQLFRNVSNVSIAVAVLLAMVYGFERLHDPSFQLAPRAVIILLILLNARQNLRQHKYAAILEKLTRAG
jgi:hypothetical protein